MQIASWLNRKLQKDHPSHFETFTAYRSFHSPQTTKQFDYLTIVVHIAVIRLLHEAYWSLGPPNGLCPSFKTVNWTRQSNLLLANDTQWGGTPLLKHPEGMSSSVSNHTIIEALSARHWTQNPANHDALHWTLNLIDTPGKFSRWSFDISAFDLKFAFWECFKHQNAHAFLHHDLQGRGNPLEWCTRGIHWNAS